MLRSIKHTYSGIIYRHTVHNRQCVSYYVHSIRLLTINYLLPVSIKALINWFHQIDCYVNELEYAVQHS